MSETKESYTFVFDDESDVKFDVDTFKQWFKAEVGNPETISEPSFHHYEYALPELGMPSVEKELGKAIKTLGELKAGMSAMFDVLDGLIEGDLDLEERALNRESRMRFLAGKGFQKSRFTGYVIDTEKRIAGFKAAEKEALLRAEKAEELAVQQKLRADVLEEELRNVEE